MNYPTVYLASNSPRRFEIFKNAGFKVELLTNTANEDFDASINVNMVARNIAIKKMQAFIDFKDKLIVSADTTVVINNTVLNKPIDNANAIEMLETLSGNVHKVITGVCVNNYGNLLAFDCTTLVEIKKLTKEEILFYVKTCKPFDKAGAYGIQDWMGLVGVKSITGCYYNVMGFPMHTFVKEIGL